MEIPRQLITPGDSNCEPFAAKETKLLHWIKSEFRAKAGDAETPGLPQARRYVGTDGNTRTVTNPLRFELRTICS